MSQIPQTVREQVTNAIRDELVSGRFEAGTMLRETELANRLGVSRGPVRDAFINSRTKATSPITPIVVSWYGILPILTTGSLLRHFAAALVAGAMHGLYFDSATLSVLARIYGRPRLRPSSAPKTRTEPRSPFVNSPRL